eukprot:9756139-Alexandrium_andersonii.AAC.1
MPTSGGRNGCWRPVDPTLPRNRGNGLVYQIGVDEPAPEYVYPEEVACNWLRPPLLASEVNDSRDVCR